MGEMLQGRAVVVTGAGSGLGRAYALAAAAAGAWVVVNDLDQDAGDATVRVIRSTGGRALLSVGSVAVAEVAERMVSDCVAEFGRIDGLVNNAGILRPGHPIEQGDSERRLAMETNVLGPMNCGTAAMRVMLQQGSGSIVNVVSGAMQGLPGLSLYGATKGAVMGLTYGWALELAGTGVRVNAISPLASTPMSASIAGDDSLKGDAPNTVAPAVVYLLSDRSSSLNGQIIRFDGHRLGVVAAPHLAAVTPDSVWTSESIALAFDGNLGRYLRGVGLAASPSPEVVG